MKLLEMSATALLAEHPGLFPVESRAAIPGLHSDKDR